MKTETVKEIKSTRLIEIMQEIENSFNEIKKEQVQMNAQSLMYHAKKIEIGEKKLKRELSKREQQMRNIQHELSVIQELAQKVGYNLEG